MASPLLRWTLHLQADVAQALEVVPPLSFVPFFGWRSSHVLQ